jgi:hypothetical protein
MAPAAPAQESLSPNRQQAGNQAAQERLKAAAAGRDPQGKRGALPFRDKLKSSMGIDFAGAAAIFGAKDALAGEGAKAAQVGKTLLFAEERPSLETVAHEAAHFAQREKGGATSPGTDKGGGLAEAEAHDAADAVVKGEVATLEAPAEAAVHRLTDPNPTVENPDEQSYTDPTTPVYDDESDSYGDPADPATHAEKQAVLLTSEENPYSALQPPASDLLYKEVEEGGTPFTSAARTVGYPLEMTAIRPDSLYINDTPAVEDIVQGSLGDCYFLAVLTSVVASDPGHLKSILSLQGDVITADFWAPAGTDTNGAPAWTPTTVTMDRQLLTDSEEYLVGAEIRREATPSQQDWWAAVEEGSLLVFRKDLFQAALWAPMMEKAYAIYAEANGQYGEGATGEGGYTAIGEGGFEHLAVTVLYGPDIESNEVQEFEPTTFTGELTDEHIPILLGLAAARNAPSEDSEDTTHTLVQAGTTTEVLFERLDQDLENAWPTPETEQHEVKWLLMRIEGAAVVDMASESLAADILLEASHDPLWDTLDPAGLAWQDLHETVDTLSSNAENWSDQRADDTRGDTSLNLYTPHRYTVLGADFFDACSEPLKVTAATVPELLPQIDPQSSTVLIRNPHGDGEPTTHGTDQKNDGEFTMTLHQYLHSFTHQTVTEVSA